MNLSGAILKTSERVPSTQELDLIQAIRISIRSAMTGQRLGPEVTCRREHGTRRESSQPLRRPVTRQIAVTRGKAGEQPAEPLGIAARRRHVIALGGGPTCEVTADKAARAHEEDAHRPAHASRVSSVRISIIVSRNRAADGRWRSMRPTCPACDLVPARASGVQAREVFHRPSIRPAPGLPAG